jgi:hypothetical protein
MTAKEKCDLNEALDRIKENIAECVNLLSQPNVSLDIVAHCLEWADPCYEDIVQGVDAARDDDGVDLDTFTTLCWVQSDLARVCHALRYCLEEQPRSD